jgi:uncharacterized protein YjbI with pentapeptide repeats
MSSSYGLRLSVKKPVFEWCSGIGFDFKKLFVSVATAALSAATHNWMEAVKKLIDASSALKVKHDPAELAWILITRALVRCISGIVPLQALGTLQFSKDQVKAVCDRLDLTFQQQLLVIDQDFFASASDFPLLVSLAPPLCVWLEELFLTPKVPEDLLRRLRAEFPQHLHDEWAAHPERYEQLEKVFQSPFVHAIIREKTWERYASSLDKDLSRSRLDPNAPLSKCYVPMRGYIELAGDPSKPSSTRQVIEVFSELENWLDEKSTDTPMRILSGELGSGKTSTSKSFAARTNKAGLYKALFISMSELSLQGGLHAALNEAANRYELPDLLGSNAERCLLLILDGLEDATNLAPEQLLAQADLLCSDLNRYQDSMRLLITAKPPLVASLPRMFRLRRGVITLLPHLIPENERGLYSDPSNLLHEDRRQNWCAKYSKTTGTDLEYFKGLISSNKQLLELSAQPLLLHLLALSRNLNALSTDEQIELTSVYGQLLREVHDRNWGGRFAAAKSVSFDEFCIFFEQLAWQMWQSGKRNVQLSDCHNVISASSKRFPHLQVNSDSDLVRLLGTFFLVELTDSAIGSERTFAFVHRGFSDYLLSRRLIREVETFVRRLESAQMSESNLDEILFEWLSFSGKNALSYDHLRFLKSEMRLRAPEILQVWLNYLTSALQVCIRDGLSLGNQEGNARFWEFVDRTRNSSEALLALVHCCATTVNKVVAIDYGSQDRFGQWLSLIEGQRRGRENRIVMSCLELFDFRPSRDLVGKDFLRANLKRSLFSGAKLRWALFREADLSGASLNRGADLRDCDFQGADLSDADLSGALLQGANLKWANLENAILEDCDFEGADLHGARLRGARCRDASFRRAVLTDIECALEEVHDLNTEGAIVENQRQKDQGLAVDAGK